MQLIVFGATGKTGQQIVTQALQRGHSVRAFVRDPAKLRMAHDKLEIVTGDVLEADVVGRALSEPADAVVSALGIYHREPRTELSDGTRNIVTGMERHGIARLAIVSSLGVGDSKGQGNFLARNLQKILLSQVLADKERQEALIRASALDWTVVRPPQLTDRDRVADNVAAWQGASPRRPKLTWKTSRATVASFILDAVENDKYSKAAVNISETK